MNEITFNKEMIDKSNTIVENGSKSPETILNELISLDIESPKDYANKILELTYKMDDIRPEYFLNPEVETFEKMFPTDDKLNEFKERTKEYQLSEQQSYQIAENIGWDILEAHDDHNTFNKSKSFNPDYIDKIDELYNDTLADDVISIGGLNEVLNYTSSVILPDVSLPKNDQDLDEKIELPENDNSVDNLNNKTKEENVEDELLDNTELKPYNPSLDFKDKNRLIEYQKSLLEELQQSKRYDFDKGYNNAYNPNGSLVMNLGKSYGSEKISSVNISIVTGQSLSDGFELLSPEDQILRKIKHTDKNVNAFEECLQLRLSEGKDISNIKCGKGVHKDFKDILERYQESELELGFENVNDNSNDNKVEEPDNVETTKNVVEEPNNVEDLENVSNSFESTLDNKDEKVPVVEPELTSNSFEPTFNEEQQKVSIGNIFEEEDFDTFSKSLDDVANWELDVPESTSFEPSKSNPKDDQVMTLSNEDKILKELNSEIEGKITNVIVSPKSKSKNNFKP